LTKKTQQVLKFLKNQKKKKGKRKTFDLVFILAKNSLFFF